MYKYTCYGEDGEILDTGNNKKRMIDFCSYQNGAATIVDERCGEIIYCNRTQRDIDSGKQKPGKTHWFDIRLYNKKTGHYLSFTVKIEADEENAYRFATNRGIEILRETRKSGEEPRDKWFLKAVTNTTYFRY